MNSTPITRAKPSVRSTELKIGINQPRDCEEIGKHREAESPILSDGLRKEFLDAKTLR
jgi:hypothetical protein